MTAMDRLGTDGLRAPGGDPSDQPAARTALDRADRAVRDRGPEPRRAVESLLGAAFTEGNRVDVLRNGDEIFPAMLAAIRGATRSIDLLTYLWGKGPVTEAMTEALSERARTGVRVRVVVDALGSKGMRHHQVAALRDAGVDLAFFRPLSTPRATAKNRRTHARALICDETVGFTGGTGIDQGWTGDGVSGGDWRDTSFRVQGPAVDGLRAAFAAHWVQTRHDLITDHDRFATPSTAGDAAVHVLRVSSQHGWNDVMLALIGLLHSAQHRVRICTPYARLPRQLLDLVRATAGRGVQVQLLLPAESVVDHPLARVQEDHQHQWLLDAGVEIWSYRPSMLHAKVVTVDGALAMVGSANIDARSLTLNLQVQMLIADPATVAVLDRHYDEDLTRSERTDPGAWERRSARQRLTRAAADVIGRPIRGLGPLGVIGRRR